LKYETLVRSAARFFSPHPLGHLLGVCWPDLLLRQLQKLANERVAYCDHFSLDNQTKVKMALMETTKEHIMIAIFRLPTNLYHDE
jgi:hypothetical protein